MNAAPLGASAGLDRGRQAGSVRRLTLWALAAAAFAAAWVGFSAQTALAGDSSDGTFSTSVSVTVPTFHGIEPSIALNYDSARPDGLVGVGWRLDAASYVARTGPHGGAPRFDGTDIFTLDGERLVGCAPSCATGGTHETRRSDFTRISFDGKRWARWRPDGVRLVYDPLPLADAKGTYRWALSTVTDTHGNTVAYGHDCDGTECYLKSIAYADGPERCTFRPRFGQVCWPGPAGARIRFYYEDRPDPVSYGTGGALAVISKRLKTIEVRMGGDLVRAYALAYQISKSTGNSLLRSAQTFPSDASLDMEGNVSAGATKPQPPTVFSTASMSGGAGEWSAKTLPTGGLTSLAAPEKASYDSVFKDIKIPNRAGEAYDPRTQEVVRLPHGSVQGDFDGDMRTDVAFWGQTSCGGKLHITTVLAARPESPVETGPEPGPNSQSCRVPSLPWPALAADVNGDGRDDAVLMGQVMLAAGDGTFAVGAMKAGVFGEGSKCTVADVDGDGRSDSVCIAKGAGSAAEIRTVRPLPSGEFAVKSQPLSTQGASLDAVQLAVGDVNADGKDDAMVAEQVRCGDRCWTWKLETGFADGSGGFGSWADQEPGWTTGFTPLGTSYEWALDGGDFDGDGRADVVLTRKEFRWAAEWGNDVAYVATSPKTAGAAPSGPFVPKPAVQLGASGTVAGDSNGDGKDDLLTSGGEALAVGDGLFSWVPGRVTGCGAPADTNGDGRADRLCVADFDVDEFTAHDTVAPNRPADLHRWMPADVTGTGRQALVYVQFRNPGYEVYTLTRQPSGKFSRSAQTILSQDFSPLDSPDDEPPLTNANAGAWMPLDVGSPKAAGGGPDGKTDLVMVDRDGGKLRVYTLLSTGSGWEAKADAPWPGNYGPADVQNWRPANLNGDGRADLVHLVTAGPGVRVEYLLSKGDGSWTSGTTSAYFAKATPAQGARPDIPALGAANVQDFRSIDTDGDSFTDFVFAERLEDITAECRGDNARDHDCGTVIRSLAGNGDGSFSERTDSDPAKFTAAQVHALETSDFNGDGLGDLSLLRLGPGCLWVEAFVSTGAGWTLDEAPPAAGCRPQVGVEDTNNTRLGDVDYDNRTDVLHLSRYLDQGTGKTAVHLLSNRAGQRWPVSDPPALALEHPDTWAYASMDTDSDGRSELVHVDGVRLDTLRFDTSSDLLSEIDNGRGATTRVSYRPLAGARSYLPSGSLPTVVDTVTTSDTAHDPPVEETTSWTYQGARWSETENELLGFESVRSTQGGSVAETGYELSGACGARPASVSVEDTKGNVLTLSDSEFSPPGSAPPFRCLTHKVVARDCEQHDRQMPPAEGDEDKPKKDCRESDTVPATTTSFDYDAYGNLTSKTETGARAGRRTTTGFQPNTDAYIVDRPARQQTDEYDPDAPAGEEWRRTAATEYVYDGNSAWDSPPGAKGELRRARAWDDRADQYVEASFGYDAHGNLTTTTGPTGVVEQTDYDTERALFPVKICNPAVGCRTQTWKLKFGALDTATDLNGQTTGYDYDAYGRPTKVTNPDGGSSSTSYLDEGSFHGADSQRQRIRTQTTDGSRGDGVLWQEQLLDGLGRAYKTIREGDGSGPIVSETRFADASDRPAVTVDPHVGCCGAWTEYRYDEAHRPARTILPDGATSETEYRPGATLARDPAGRETTAVRDEFGRTIRIEQLDRHPCPGCAPRTSTTRYRYDALDRRTRITDPKGNLTTTVWDSLGRKVSEHDPDRGERSWTWRDDGSPDTATDAKGQVTRWFYDDAGRPVRKTEARAAGPILPERTIEWIWDRDPSDGGNTHGYSLGRLIRVEYSSPGVSGRTDSWYDRMGRPERTRQCVDDSCAELGFGYDKAGRLATLSYPDAQRGLSNKSEQVTQSYDGAGRLASVTGHDPASLKPDTAYATQLSYDPLGQLKQLTHSNGVIDSLSYDDNDTARHWLDSITVTRPASPTGDLLYSASYQHNPDGKLRSQTETPGQLSQEYQYDDLGRLTTVTASDPDRSRDYGYDELGRMTSSSTAGGYSYGDSAHLHAPTSTGKGHTRSYDPNGSLETLHDPGGRDLTIDWTVSGMPERIVSRPNGTATTIGYDAGDQRVVKHDQQGTTYYLGRYLQQDPGGRLVKYYWAGDRLIAVRDGNGKLTDYHQDRLGSTRLLTNAKGVVVERHDYDPYGKPLNPPAGDGRLWQSQRHDHDSGLTDLTARYYDPELGQFTAADSIIPDPYRPQSLDRYAYTENDPINYTDPSGHIRRDIDLKKEQEHQGFAYQWMYFKSLAAQCAWFGQCPETAAPDRRIYKETPGRASTPNAESGCPSCKLGGKTLTLDPDIMEMITNPGGTPATAEKAQAPADAGSAEATEAVGAKDAGSGDPSEIVIAQWMVAAETSTGSSATLAESRSFVRRALDLTLDLVYPERHLLRGPYVEAAGSGCIFICFAAGSFDIGIVATPVGPDDWFVGEVRGFISLGGAFTGFTLGPGKGLAEPIGPIGHIVPGIGVYPSFGLSSSLGFSVMGLWSDEVRTIADFSEWARNLSGGLGPFTLGRSTNTSGQHIYNYGLGSSRGNPVGVSVYNTYTWTFP
ncbi:RHS repeat-associated core domain-containing protein [Mycobacterium sp.]|uniref:RHS repeat-associated core domain-containing protein n=1 Tax=Mycobacterium sp. TaxID=1785 RepID=UPI002B653F46|nr:RHS repeat-associated core domain-containing protein [Mycobacterium sp.]HTQ21993.1 RHS repeat-associated core domain-containing protein [Mycobacterium sp.]